MRIREFLIASLMVALSVTSFSGCGDNNSDDSIPVINPPGSGYTYTNASLTGNYWVTTFTSGQDPVNYRSSLDGYNAGGTGYATFSLKAADRLTGVILDSGNAAYTVSLDGTFTLTPTGYQTLNGALGTTALGAYSELGVMSRVGTIGEQTSSVLVRATATTHSNSSLIGTYYIVSIRDYSSEAGPRAIIGSLISDGAGSATIAATASTYGASPVPLGDNMTYNVVSDGTMTATTSADLTAFGGVLSNSKSVAALSATMDRNKQEAIYMVKAPALLMTNASLTGTYFMSTSYRGFFVGWGAAIRSFSFDGAGNLSMVGIKSESLTGPAQTVTATGTYAMNADGTFTLTFGGLTYVCGLSDDASAFVVSYVNDPLYVEAGLAIKQ